MNNYIFSPQLQLSNGKLVSFPAATNNASLSMKKLAYNNTQAMNQMLQISPCHELPNPRTKS
jgi:hypothetical protein